MLLHAANVVDLNVALRAIDRDADRRLAVLANRIRSRAAHQVRSGEPLDLTAEHAMLSDLIERVMITSHLRAMDIHQPAYALARSEIDKALSKAPKHVRAALREVYGSIARSISDQPMSVVRDRLLKQAGDVAAGVKGKGGNIRTAVQESGIEFEDTPVLRTVIRTQGSIAFNAATYQAGQTNDEVWGYQVVTQQDERVRKTHLAFEPNGVGVRYRFDDEFWDKYVPPFDWNCRCGLKLLFRGDKDARKRPFPGTPDVPKSFQFNAGQFFSLVQATKAKQKKR